MMLVVSKGCFTLIDTGDAAIRARGELLVFAMHLNYVGICAFVKEISHEVVLGTTDFVVCFSTSFNTKMGKTDRIKQGGDSRIGDLDSSGA